MNILLYIPNISDFLRASLNVGMASPRRLWTYVRDDRPAAQTTAPAVWFAYSEDRKGEHPRRHLKNYSGALQADAYSGLHHYLGSSAPVKRGTPHAYKKTHHL